MKAAKRFTVRVTVPANELECIGGFTDEHASTTTLDTLMFVWDPFYDRTDEKSSLQCVAKAIAG